MTTVLDVQRRLAALGLSPGPLDGLLGPSTLAAMMTALDRLPNTTPAPAPPVAVSAVPLEWMPWAHMQRVVFHWTAGANKASALDRSHYHILIEGDGKLVQGTHSIADNQSAADGVYAAHTRGLNTQSIGVSLCGMAGAEESPFDRGDAPITHAQWQTLARVLADLCRRYSIPVTRQTVLSHAEVQPTLGIKQAGKWDIARLPWDVSAFGAVKIGDQMREMVKALL